jgi:uncharacterized protein YceK
MKNIFICLCVIGLLSSCSMFRSRKTGCPTSGAAIGAERILSGEDPKAARAASKSKYKGKRKVY